MRVPIWLTALILLTSEASGKTSFGPGVAMHGEPKYPQGFAHYEYADPKAPVGGELVISRLGTFDSLNPFAAKGSAAVYLDWLFPEMLDRGRDEPFTKYPALATHVKIAPDRLSMELTLHPRATFADGTPITAEDIVFTLKTLRSEAAHPFFSSYYKDIKSVKALAAKKVKFIFAKVNPELPLITLELQPLSKKFYGKGDFGKDFTTKVLGYGPYTIEKYEMGSYVLFKRNSKWWGWDVPAYKGRFNFARIRVKYFRDDTALLEAFKKGDFAMYHVFSSKSWAKDVQGDKFDKGYILKELWPHQNNQGSQGFIFNLRKPIFQDIRVRKAIALAFDFAWSNKNLFYGQYKENSSFFENSPLAARGKLTAEEKAVLDPYRQQVPAEVFSQEMGSLGRGVPIKKRLRLAKKLLNDAGYKVKGGVATGPGGKLEFKILMRQSFDRIVEPYAKNLRRLGINLLIDKKDSSVWVRRVEARDYDMMVGSVGQSMSPGNEQADFWTTAAADNKLSRNYAGIKNKAVDALVEKVIYAKDRKQLELYTRCLDRVLYHLHFQVHNWHIDAHRVTYWNKFGMPKRRPKFYTPRLVWEFMWYDKSKAQRLTKAMKAGKSL